MSITIKSTSGRVLYVAESAADVRSAVIEAVSRSAKVCPRVVAGQEDSRG